ncbi:MAG: zf-HC2 domain-containing protein [Cyanobacteria bacterium J06600_6]
MTSQFEDSGRDRLAELSTDDFELISAYLDDELSPAEKAQVQSWIDLDPDLKAVYTRMLSLQGQMQNIDIPECDRSVAEITSNVFQSLDRRRRQRRVLIGIGAIAASALAGIIGSLSGTSSGSFRFAQSPTPEISQPETVMLAVALNKPAINIPKAINSYDFE